MRELLDAVDYNEGLSQHPTLPFPEDKILSMDREFVKRYDKDAEKKRVNALDKTASANEKRNHPTQATTDQPEMSEAEKAINEVIAQIPIEVIEMHKPIVLGQLERKRNE